MSAAIESGDLAEFTRCVDTQTVVVDQIGQPTLRWMSDVRRWGRLLLSGDASGAEALIGEIGRGIFEAGDPEAPMLERTTMAWVGWYRGETSQVVVDAIAANVANNPTWSLRAELARVYADAGRYADSAGDLLSSQVTAGFQGPYEHRAMLGLLCWAEVAARVGDSLACGILYERLAPWPDQVVWNGGMVFGAVAHYLGHLATVLERYDVAETLSPRPLPSTNDSKLRSTSPAPTSNGAGCSSPEADPVMTMPPGCTWNQPWTWPSGTGAPSSNNGPTNYWSSFELDAFPTRLVLRFGPCCAVVQLAEDVGHQLVAGHGRPSCLGV